MVLVTKEAKSPVSAVGSCSDVEPPERVLEAILSVGGMGGYISASGTALRDAVPFRRGPSGGMLKSLAVEQVFGVYIVDAGFGLIPRLKNSLLY